MGERDDNYCNTVVFNVTLQFQGGTRQENLQSTPIFQASKLLVVFIADSRYFRCLKPATSEHYRVTTCISARWRARQIGKTLFGVNVQLSRPILWFHCKANCR